MKRHYYVPRALLRNFATEKEQMWSCRADAKHHVFEAHITKLFVEKHIHRQVLADGVTDLSVEEAFSRIESISAELLDPLIKFVRHDQKSPQMTLAQRCLLIEIVTSFGTRDPNFFGEIDKDSEFRIKFLQTMQELDIGLTDEDEKEMMHNIRAQGLIRRKTKTASMLSKRGITFCLIEHDLPSLVIGNQPLVLASLWSGLRPSRQLARTSSTTEYHYFTNITRISNAIHRVPSKGPRKWRFRRWPPKNCAMR